VTFKKPDTEISVLALFERALDHPSNEREAWIEKQADWPANVRNRALDLLKADHGDQAMTQVINTINQDQGEMPLPERIGAYKIVDVIGRGGMGVVYEGVRDRGDFDHRVAIKVTRPGLLSKTLEQRFTNEREILASLTHPGIARLFDGGALDDNSPYMIMEFVEGISIIKWADKVELNERARIKLFIQVLEAIRHAHQNLIIHRDITPSNVLVTLEGNIKVIDFGIAKPQVTGTDGDDFPASLNSLSFTPGFAAPERELGNASNILTDIYSLGKLLDALMQETNIESDMAAIIAQAVSDAPEHRYASTDIFLDDVKRYLDGLPVAAMGGSNQYRLKKFVLRYPVGVAVAVSFILSLAGGLAITTNLYKQAETARVEAQAARTEADKRFNDVRSLANTMIFDIYDELDGVSGTFKGRTILASAAQNYLTELAAAANDNDTLKLEVAKGFNKVTTIDRNLTGHFKHDGAYEDSLTQSIEILDVLHRKYPQNAEIRLSLAEAGYQQYILDAVIERDFVQGNKIIQKTLPLLEPITNDVIATSSETLANAIGLKLYFDVEMINLSVLQQRVPPDTATEKLLLLDDLGSRLLEKYPNNRAVFLGADRATISLAFIQILLDDSVPAHAPEGYETAVQYLQKALSRTDQRLEEQSPDTRLLRHRATTFQFLGLAYTRIKDANAATTNYETALKIYQQLSEKEPSNIEFKNIITSISLDTARVHLASGNYILAEKLWLDALELRNNPSLYNPNKYAELETEFLTVSNLTILYRTWDKSEKKCHMANRQKILSNQMRQFREPNLEIAGYLKIMTEVLKTCTES